MAIVVLVLWMFTAGAGFFLLVTSNLGRSRPAEASAEAPVPASATVSAATSTASSPSKRELKRAARERFDPPSLAAARNAPMMPGLRSLLEFAHPAFAIIGLGFWLTFTLVHNHVLGWIAFGLVAATACLGLSWFTANARAARRRDRGETAPSFGIRLVVLHGGAATVTFALAALSALVLSR
ncbi:MAG: hypothetical protein ABSB59_02590 [Streptosporangiaceae bacterium]|jgi:hypothetical protein